MKNAAVIGDPVGHSMSPALFARLARLEGFQGFNYEARKVTESELGQFFQNAKNELVGFNVTIPHKEAVIPLLNKVSPSALAVGAVNVVSFSKAMSEGFNTDVDGFSECLTENKLDLKGKKILIIGAGGAAKAVAYALGKLHCQSVTVLNKTLSRAQKLVDSMVPHFPETRFDAFSHVGEVKNHNDFHLIVNSTPMGMDGILFTPQNKEFFQEILTTFSDEKTVIFDLIYRPEETPLIKMARAQGSLTIGGLSMLVNQALATWEIWIGPLKNKAAIKKDLGTFLTKTMAVAKNNKAIFLTGFMAVGKSTVGKLLARNLGWKFVDTDSLVEKKAGKTIPEIFAGPGETEFRRLEQRVIEELAQLQNTVVALGGGALINESSLKRVKESGSLIYLSATTENLVARLKGTQDIRPLLKENTGDITSVVANMFSARQGQYLKAHLSVATDKLEADQVVEKVIASLGGRLDS